MISAGHKDWLGLNPDPANFEVAFRFKADRLEQDYVKAADDACKLFHAQYNQRPLYLAFSGGIDSEFVAETLWRNQVPFTPVILKIQDFNAVESWYAEYWCKKKAMQPMILNLTVDQYASSLIKYSRSLIRLGNPYQVSILYIYEHVNSLGGYCINATGDINLDHKAGKFYCNTLDFASDILGLGHPTPFFMFTPDLVLSYITNFDPAVCEQHNKLKFYCVSPRPKIDYLTELYGHPEVARVVDNMYFTVPRLLETRPFWYGDRTQIINRLVTHNTN